MEKTKELHRIALRIRALAQNGLTYSKDEYDIERYHELIDLSDRITSLQTGLKEEKIDINYKPMKEYQTPKVDIRAVVFNEKEEILLVKEAADGHWSLPGGWADIGYSPAEVAVKEVKEETGLEVVPERLLAVLDMSKHPHPAIPFYVYKMFIACRIAGGEFNQVFDIEDKGFFACDSLPPLSLERVLPEEILRMRELYRAKEICTDLD